MADYDNSRYTYAQVLAGTGYYMQNDLLRYSDGVKTMQGKLNTAGYNCGTPDGKFGAGTGFYMLDSKLRYSDGVKTMQGKLTSLKEMLRNTKESTLIMAHLLTRDMFIERRQVMHG